MLSIVLDMERVDHPQQGHDREDIGKNQAQLVDPAKHQVLSEETHFPIGTRRHAQAEGQGRCRQQEHRQAPGPAFEEGECPGPQDQQQSRVHPLKSHNSLPGA